MQNSPIIRRRIEIELSQNAHKGGMMVRQIIGSNYTENTQFENGAHELVQLIKAGNYPAVEEFAQKHKNITQIINAPAHNTERSLQESVRFSRVKITHLLLELGADPNIPNSKGYTPLMFAVWGGKVKLVMMLLKCGADIKMKTDTGHDVFHFAKDSGCKHVLHSLTVVKEYGASMLPCVDVSNEPLYDIRQLTLAENIAIRNETKDAVEKNDIDTVKEKLQQYQGLANYQGDPLWCSLIIVAAEAGLTYMVSLLIDMGEDMHAPYGCFIALSPFSRALKNKHFDVCTLLIERGVKTIEEENDLIDMLEREKSPQGQNLRGAIIARQVANKLT